MKPIKRLVLYFFPAILCLGLTGCSSPLTVTPQPNGYEEVTHPHRSGAPADVQISFRHRAPNGSLTPIWPALYGVNEVIHGEVAIFVGEVAYLSSNPEDPRGTRPRLFAVKSPALPLDITDEILAQWSQTNAKDFAQARKRLSLVTPAEKDGRLELQLEFWSNEKNWPDTAALLLDWNRVSDIMQEVKEKGTVRKDLRWKTPYIAR
jgi:hypothetical protein